MGVPPADRVDPDGQGEAPHADILRYLEQLRVERGYSPRTLAAYRADLAELRALARERSPGNAAPDWHRVDERAVRGWVARASRQALSPRSIALMTQHQIGTLFANAKLQELEMLEKRASGMKSKAETAGKYGW